MFIFEGHSAIVFDTIYSMLLFTSSSYSLKLCSGHSLVLEYGNFCSSLIQIYLTAG
uniref:Uncharacterized protein n=1 Tax=Rhizophora mucronata TaxID=61149 RepID=A0A2P2N280_RHIMU